MKLTKSQKKALKELNNFVNGPKKYHIFSGPAGTGKSTLIGKFLSQYDFGDEGDGYTVAVSSPTHKALKNVKNIVNNAENVDSDLIFYSTIHALLGLYLIVDEGTGKGFLNQGGGISTEQRLKQLDLVIVDEYSMINSFVLNSIKRAAKHYSIKFLFCGDKNQLPPIYESIPPVCYEDYNESLLTEVVRYDGELSYVAENIRSDKQYDKEQYPFKQSEDNTVQTYKSRSDWLNLGIDLIQDLDYTKDENKVRFLAWENKQCLNINMKVRERLLGANRAKSHFVVGDFLMAKGNCFDLDGELILNNSYELIVTEDAHKTTSLDGKYEYWDLLARTIPSTGREREVSLRILDFGYEYILKDHLKALKWDRDNNHNYGSKSYKALSREMKTLREFYHDVSYAHAITVHKSQGSTFENVFVDVDNIFQTKQNRQKMLYTAVTRASKAIHVVDEDCINVNNLFN